MCRHVDKINVTQRHKEVRDLLHDLSALVWHQTIKEPVTCIQEASPDQEALIGDFSARGVWQPQATAVFDIKVINSDAPHTSLDQWKLS